MAKKNNFAVSVIVAMYNAEKYIGECLTSLANQTFKDFEVIVVDDCSTDNSIEAVKNFFADFGDRLKLAKLSKNSGNAGTPRNFALKAARGKYIYFLDSDDFLTTTALEELYNVAENFNADVVHGDKCLSFFDGEDKLNAELMINQTGAFVTEPTLETFDIGERVTGFVQKKFFWWACNKLFRRQMLVDNKITFPPTTTFEDFVFAFKSLVAAKNYVRVPFVSYYYRLRENSLSKKKVTSGENFMGNIIINVSELNNFMSDRKFFRDNPIYTYSVIDFFMKYQLEQFTEKIFLSTDYDVGTVYDFLTRKIFSVNPKENVALTSYLFVATNILSIYTNQQAAEIDALKRQLAALKK
ncbi:MAG: glycosyltransferase family 2 protein [Selenomonadaceae bacterium]|nr:glycosyltransferase family 2 protein [Selenomonadaceae bacterium]